MKQKTIPNNGNGSKSENGSVQNKGSIPDAMRRATQRGLEILPEKATGKEKGTTRAQVSNYLTQDLMETTDMGHERAANHMRNWDSK